MLPQLRELYTLLNENYVEDDGNMFRFDYSPEFLLWWVPRAAGGARAGGSRCPPVPVSPPCLPPPPGAHWRLFSLPAVDFRALRPPGWRLQWHCGVRVSSNRKLVGFISAIPANIRIYDRCVIITRRCPVRGVAFPRIAVIITEAFKK